MDINLLQGVLASAIGIILFAMGYRRGIRSGIQAAVDGMLESGYVAQDNEGKLLRVNDYINTLNK
jgi:hypothetical protein